MNDDTDSNGGQGTTDADEGLVTGPNHGRAAENKTSPNPEDYATSESDLALSNQVAEREPGHQNDVLDD